MMIHSVIGCLSSSDNDPYFANVVSLLHFNGANGSTTFTDVKGVAWTRGGTPTISTAQSKFGGSSGVFNGTTDYLYTALSSSFNLSGGDFTIECFVYLNNRTGDPYLFHFYADGLNRYTVQVLASSGYILLYNAVDVSYASYPTTTVVANNQWVHIALSRVGSSTRLFVDGVLALTASGITFPNLNTQVVLACAQFAGSSNFLNGYTDELRITKGVGRYTTNFTPPTYQAPDS